MTIKDIAKRFNTSVSVISRALNDSGYVSFDKRQAIKEYAAAHHWQPSHAARSLKRTPKDAVGILMPWVLRNQMDFIPMMLNMLYDAKKNCQLIIANNENGVAQLAAMPVEKIIAVNITSEQYPAIKRAIEGGIAVLNVMGFCADIPSIRVTHEKVIYDCMKHLTDAGHRKIAYVGLDLERPQTNLHRHYLKMAQMGLQKAAEESNIVLQKNVNMLYSDVMFNFDADRIRQMLNDYKPTAVIAWSEQAEAILYRICHEMGLDIPQDISLIGMGGNDMLNGFNPQPVHYRFDYDAILEEVKTFIDLPPGKFTGQRTVDFKFYPGKSIKTIRNNII